MGLLVLAVLFISTDERSNTSTSQSVQGLTFDGPKVNGKGGGRRGR